MTTAEAAAYLGLKDSRVRQLARKELLPAVKVGRDWLIEREAVERYRATLAEKNVGKPGRPFKVKQPD